MAQFQVRLVNHEYVASSEQEAVDFDTACTLATKGALDLGADMVVGGRPFFGAEMTVSGGDRSERFLVAIGVSPLK